MKITFTSFDSTRGLRQPGDQTGSRRQKSFCVLRFEINGTSAAEDLENLAMFSVHRVFYTSAP